MSAIKSCDPSKFPGCDGFNLNFIKKFWNEICEEIIQFTTNFFSIGVCDESINIAWVTLIPKISNPIKIKIYYWIDCE